MPTTAKPKSTSKVRAQDVSGLRKKNETRLSIPPMRDVEASEKAVRQIIFDWLVPTLLEKYLAAQGISSPTRFAVGNAKRLGIKQE